MRSPAAAIAWEFRQRHHWGLIALAGYLLVLAVIRPGIFEAVPRVNFDDSWSFAFVVVVPLTVTFLYFVAVFSFGLAGDLAARQSIYPARMFTLPVTNAALAGWPMLYGSGAMVLLWLATRLLAVWPSGIVVPSVWPALLAAALLAWTQALTWMPYPLPGLRVIVAVLGLATMDAVVLLAIQFRAPESMMVAILAPQVPLAYLVARAAVARARRGDVPDWRGRLARRRRIADGPPARRDRFPSPARAQAWFEWRQLGRSLPGWVAILLPFELALLFVTGGFPELVFLILLGVLLTPVFMATFGAATVRRSNPHGSDSHGVPPFIAARPLTTAALVAAKLKATLWSTLAAWLLVVVAIPLGLMISGTAPVVVERARRLSEAIGTPRVAVIVLLLFAGLIASTWKQLVQSLYIGLTGREWLIKGSVFGTLALLFLIGPIAQWIIEHREVQGGLWDALPSMLALLVGVKMAAAAWIVTRLYHTHLLSDRALVTGAVWWCVSVLTLYGLFAWFFSSPFFPRYVLMLIAILAVPLARLSAAPLALAWNRHR
ncbi:MAG: hypothetical protein ABI836_07920 [Gemmatimonadota bacterium]